MGNNAFSTGWAIFRKSVTQLAYNFVDALKISMPIFAIVFVAVLIFGLSAKELRVGPELSAGGVLLLAIVFVVAITLFCWLAILWHRFMLLNDGSDNLLSKWNGARIWAYFKLSFLLGLMLVLMMLIPFIILGFFLGGVTRENIVLASILLYAFILFFYYMFLRFGMVLPAAALDKNMTFGEAFASTDGHKGAIFVAGTLMIFVLVFVGTLIDLSGVDNVAFGIPSFVFQWFYTMTGISILTTLYGHIIEKRTLD